MDYCLTADGLVMFLDRIYVPSKQGPRKRKKDEVASRRILVGNLLHV